MPSLHVHVRTRACVRACVLVVSTAVHTIAVPQSL
jgi:hypothetical protein